MNSSKSTMKTITVDTPFNLKVVKYELDFSSLLKKPEPEKKPKIKRILIPNITINRKKCVIPPPPLLEKDQKRDTKDLVEELLDELYAEQRDWSGQSGAEYSRGSTSIASLASSQSNFGDTEAIERHYLESLDIDELRSEAVDGNLRLQQAGERLAKHVRARDRLKREQKRLCGALSVLLRHISGVSGARFSLTPGTEGPGEGGHAEWHQAMRLVARLPAGVPHHFRRKLWLTLSERHLSARGVDWPSAERACFRGTAQPDDTELGAQIIKDLHRTGCSLFCGAEGRENQGMLRRVLLAYARWNKEVGYCQGFNMLAAIILEVMDKSESDSLKVMIYLVEAVLPEGYFADDLRGLSADMAAFRDLLRLRLPRLAHHMDYLQKISDGGGVEPPLPDVFTMQWFLTLYATWLPRECLLRIWDLVLLDGNEVLLLTALAIWDLLQDRILSARSADEFYSCMGGGAGVIWEAGEALVARVVAFGSAPELPRLRNLHRYRVAPPAPPTSAPIYQPPIHSAMQSMTKRGLRLFYSEDEGDSSDDGNKMALATVMPRRESRSGAGDRLSLDIGALKRQYARLRERQRQAHVILAAACARHAAVGVPTSPTSLTVNSLLLGKSAIVSSRGRRLGPPPGAVPPSRQSRSHEKTESRARVRSTDTISWNEEKSKKSLSRRNSVKWKDIKKDKLTKVRKASIDFDESGDGTIVSEKEANEMIASLRSRSSSETSSYSSHTNSSTDTSLCDENERGSDSDTELPDDDVETKNVSVRKSKLPISPGIRDTKISHETILKETAISSSSSFNRSVPLDISQSSVKDITHYLDSAAGEPLRTYIDEFESKLKTNVTINESECFNYDNMIFTPKCSFDSKNVLKSTPSPLSVSKIDPLASPRTYKYYDNNMLIPQRSSSPEHANIVTSPRVVQTERRIIPTASILTPSNDIRTTNISALPISPNIIPPIGTNESGVLGRLSFSNKIEDDYVSSGTIKKPLVYLSPVDLTPSNCDFLSNLKSPLHRSPHLANTRPPDIIDSFTMYDNFVPDIDLSDNNSPDIRSFPPSPDEESIIVSEDEPPIPLKIDKYFEHSPEFFGARVTDPNNADIPSRRATRRITRIPKKPDSLTLQSSHNEKVLKQEAERASSLPQSHSFTKKFNEEDSDNDVFKTTKQKTPASTSPKDYIIESGRKNSERALQIIQENSKILSRILTKQNATEKNTEHTNSEKLETVSQKSNYFTKPATMERNVGNKIMESPILKESTSDSLIGCRKRNVSSGSAENHDFVRIRPISIDDPFSLEARGILPIMEDMPKNIKSPSIDCIRNKTDTYGWENKGFLAKCDSSPFIEKPPKNFDFDYKRRTIHVPCHEENVSELKPSPTADWSRHSFSGESKASVTLPSSEPKETSTFGRRFTSDDCNYPLSSKYNDYVLSEASDICRKTANQLPKVCDNIQKTEDSQVSEFAHVVTSSISFTYEPSIDDDSLTGAISNSSDTLCQITSLDQVSTPISPKLFSVRDTPTLPKDSVEKSDTMKLESDDTCSAITSLLETDTLSSLSYPRSPSTGSYHPFPTRPLRMPKELGVKLGMYPKDTINSAPK